MDPKTDFSYSLDANLHEALAKPGGIEKEVEKTLLAVAPVEELATENARIGGEVAKVTPESPWYLVILIVALMGVLVDFLFLFR